MTQFFSRYPFFPLPSELLFNIARPDTKEGAIDAGVADGVAVGGDADADGVDSDAHASAESYGADMSYDPFLSLKLTFGITMRQRMIAMCKMRFAPIENPAAYYDLASGCMVYMVMPPDQIDFYMPTRKAG